MKIVFSPEAADDLAAITGYLVEKNPDAAVQVAGRLLSVIDSLAVGEFEGPEQQLRSGAITRSWPVPPYRVYYKRDAGQMEIVRVYHLARRPIAR